MNPQILDEGFNRRYGINLVEEVVDEDLSVSEEALDIIDNFDPVAQDFEYQNGFWSVELKDRKSGMSFWVDVSIDEKHNDVECDWNQSIFQKTNSDDMLREIVQDESSVFEAATDEAIYFLEDKGQIKQCGKGWCKGDEAPTNESLEKSEEPVPQTETPAPTEKVVEGYGNKEDLFLRAFITNLGKYNEGELVGDWVEFPIDEDEFEEKLQEIGIGSTDEFGSPYEEWFVTDYDTNIPQLADELGEYPGYDQLQEYGELIEDSSVDSTALMNAMEVVGDLKEAIEGLDNGDIQYYDGVSDWGELAEYLIDEMYGGIENYLKDCPNEIENHFDYEMLGRDLGFDSYEDDEGEYLSAGEYWCGDDNATDEEIGEAYVEAVGFEGVANADYYFDFDSWGNDLRYDNFYMTSDGCIELTR